MKIWNVPIESLKERYSSDWNEWFPKAFAEANQEFETIYPDTLCDEITSGSFLDVCSTNYFKAGQLRILSRKLFNNEIKKEDIIFFHDLWFPGIEMLAYIRNGLDLDFKICGIFHAGTWDPYDFLSKKGMTHWAYSLENSWLAFIDRIFVATEFHKNLICATRMVRSNKITVTGLPIFPRILRNLRKEKIVVFPHRLDSEKNPETFDRLAATLKNTDWSFIKTKEKCRTKEEYYDILETASIAISFADQETWGIAQQEAVFAGCIPLVPDKLSYREMYPAEYRFNSEEEALAKILKIMKVCGRTKPKIWNTCYEKLVENGEKAIPKMIEIMRSLQ